jgi:hypothetical protein
VAERCPYSSTWWESAVKLVLSLLTCILYERLGSRYCFDEPHNYLELTTNAIMISWNHSISWYDRSQTINYSRSSINIEKIAPKLIKLALKLQAENRLLNLYDFIFSHAAPDDPNVVEIQADFLADRRTIFTREPEHIKTVLTTKFTDFGKGSEFHRMWKPFLYVSS